MSISAENDYFYSTSFDPNLSHFSSDMLQEFLFNIAETNNKLIANTSKYSV